MSVLKELKKINFPEKEAWIEDALFAYKHISRYFKHKKNINVLEVGCGLGILASLLKENFSSIRGYGIEPYKSGYEKLSIKKNIISKKIKFKNISFEAYKPGCKFDIIYSVNVFEHLDDWQHYLKKIQIWLKDDGKCIILCPNYAFPYESHFRLPIIYNKSFTRLIFSKYIDNYEKKNNTVGLWDSLNFVKMSEVKKYCSRNNLSFKYNNHIFTDIIDRFNEDKAFRKRQKIVGSIANLLYKIKLINLLKAKVFERFHPYMMLEISKMKSKKK